MPREHKYYIKFNAQTSYDTQINTELRMQVSDTSNSASQLYTIIMNNITL